VWGWINIKTQAMPQKKNIDIFTSGRIGPVVFYMRYGKKCSRTHNPHIKQTEATKAAAKIFGRAIRYAKHLRHGIRSIMHNETDRAIMYKMNKAVRSWLNLDPDLSVSQDQLMYLHNLNINRIERIKFRVEVDWSQPGQVLVKFPAFNPKRNFSGKAGTTHIIWKIAVAGVTTAEKSWPVEGSKTEFQTPYGNIDLPENVISLSYSLRPGTINIVALALHLCYDKAGTRQKEKKWEPAGLIAARYEA
jgi:hypothetical protein